MCVHVGSALHGEADIANVELVARGVHAVDVSFLQHFVDVAAGELHQHVDDFGVEILNP